MNDKMQYTDADLTRIYNEANGIINKNPPITTERIFAAMRHIAQAATEQAEQSIKELEKRKA